MTDKQRIKDLEQHVAYIEDKKNREIENLKKLYYNKVAEIKTLSQDRNWLESEKIASQFDDESVRQYQLGWVEALYVIIGIGDVSKEEILKYCKDKAKEIESEL